MPAATQRSKASTLQRLDISITNHQRKCAVDLRLLRTVARTLVSELLQINRADLVIHLVAAPEITRLNESFLQHAGSTDVITFDYSEPPGGRNSTDLQGEIFVCMDEAVSQAVSFRTTWQSELARYIVHGILHLAGFDDSNAADRRRMKRNEDRWVRALGRRFPLTKLARPRSAR